MTRNPVVATHRRRRQCQAWLCLAVAVMLVVPFAGPSGAAPSGPRLSLDFVATDMVDVIKALSAQSGANIAASSKVSGQVTVRLTDVTVEEALAVVTKLNGLDYALMGNTYVVGTPDEVKAMVAQPPAPDVPITRVVALKYLPAADAIALLAQAEPELKAAASPTGGLILTATPPVLDRSAALLAGVDVAPAVGVAERAIYTVRYADPMELIATLKAVFPDLTITAAPRSATPVVTPGTSGGALAGGLAALAAPQLSATAQTPSSGTGAAGGPEMSPVTKLVLSGGPATLSRALQMCKDLDTQSQQVKITATITEVRSDVESRLGINWSDLAGKAGIVLGESSPAETDPGLAAATIAPHDLKVGKIVRSHLSIAGAISALVTEGKARIMANPSIILLDGRQATIHAGEKIFYPQVIGYTPLGGQIVQATEINIGVTLMVKPKVGPEGDITLTLVPTISSITNSVFAGYPTITERSIVTTVCVRSGQTLAIGGLLRDDETITINKVPVLGDIPIIGDLLFKSKVKHPFRSEVVIIITPEIVKDEAGG